MNKSTFCLCTFLALGSASATLAQEDQPEAEQPTAPAPASHDEVRLSSGELLQGEVVQLKDGKLKFKSKDLGEQTIPFEKVDRISTAKDQKIVLADGSELEGRIAGEGGELQLTPVGEAARTIPRGELSAINPDPEKTELDYWTFNAALGMTLTYGNTRTRTVGVLASVVREDDNTRFGLGYTSTWGVTDETETAKNHRGDAQFDYKISDRFYLTPFVGHALYDKFQNIKFRYRAGAGAGYIVVKEDDLSWQVEGGFAYSYTDRRSPVAGQPDKLYETSVRAATKVHWDINGAVTFDLFYETYIGTKNVKDTVHRVTTGLNFKLIKGLSLSIATIYDRSERPGRGPSGKRLKRNDLKAIIGFSVAI